MALIEEFNNGWIDIRRLQKLSKLVKGATFDLVRQHTFKMEQIEVALELEKILESISCHKHEGRPKAIYNSAKEPHFSE